jgi:hypothetical protein
VRVVEEALKDADLSIELVDMSGGTAHLWGAVQPEVEKRAIRAAAESDWYQSCTRQRRHAVSECALDAVGGVAR